MNQAVVESLHGQLETRRIALVNTIAEVGEASDLVRLLGDVDRALERLGTDAFGLCAVCGERFDDEEMLENPARQYCLRRLPPAKLAAACLNDVRNFQNGESQSDDVTLMIVRRTDLH